MFHRLWGPPYCPLGGHGGHFFNVDLFVVCLCPPSSNRPSLLFLLHVHFQKFPFDPFSIQTALLHFLLLTDPST